MAYASPVKRRAYQNAWAKRNHEKRNRTWNKWADKNRKKVNAKSGKYREANPAKVRLAKRAAQLKTKYGLTLDQYNALLISQNGVCAVCRNSGQVLAVDHNHVTKQVRALLCFACNSSLGLLREDPLRIRALADYVERHTYIETK